MGSGRYQPYGKYYLLDHVSSTVECRQMNDEDIRSFLLQSQVLPDLEDVTEKILLDHRMSAYMLLLKNAGWLETDFLSERDSVENEISVQDCACPSVERCSFYAATGILELTGSSLSSVTCCYISGYRVGDVMFSSPRNVQFSIPTEMKELIPTGDMQLNVCTFMGYAYTFSVPLNFHRGKEESLYPNAIIKSILPLVTMLNQDHEEENSRIVQLLNSLGQSIKLVEDCIPIELAFELLHCELIQQTFKEENIQENQSQISENQNIPILMQLGKVRLIWKPLLSKSMVTALSMCVETLKSFADDKKQRLQLQLEKAFLSSVYTASSERHCAFTFSFGLPASLQVHVMDLPKNTEASKMTYVKKNKRG